MSGSVCGVDDGVRLRHSGGDGGVCVSAVRGKRVLSTTALNYHGERWWWSWWWCGGVCLCALVDVMVMVVVCLCVCVLGEGIKVSGSACGGGGVCVSAISGKW